MSQQRSARPQPHYKSIDQLKAGYDPTRPKNRLPAIVFTGPNNLYDHRVTLCSFPYDIGIGQTSGLRTLEASYLTRGKSGVLHKRRHNMPGEIGWSVDYFQDIYPESRNYRRPNTSYINLATR